MQLCSGLLTFSDRMLKPRKERKFNGDLTSRGTTSKQKGFSLCIYERL